MFKALMGSGWSNGGRRFAAYVDRSDFWSGAAAADEAAFEALGQMTEGLAADTLIATETGWQRAADLRPGDRIVTFDNGLQVLRRVIRGQLSSEGHDLPTTAQPLSVPAGVLGNRRPLVLLSGQAVLIESDKAEALYGDPFALIPAAALEGWKGIARLRAGTEVEAVFLEFDGDEIVYAEGMALVHCARQTPKMVTTPEELMEVGTASPYRTLPAHQGRAVLAAA